MGIFRSQGQRKNVKQNGILQSNYKLENEGQTVLSNNLITLLRIITTSHYMVPEVFFVQKGVMTRKLLFFKNQTNCYTQHLCTKQVTCRHLKKFELNLFVQNNFRVSCLKKFIILRGKWLKDSRFVI